MSVFQGCEPVAPHQAPPPDYANMTKAELSAFAAGLGLAFPAKATKTQMIEAIEAVRG